MASPVSVLRCSIATWVLGAACSTPSSPAGPGTSGPPPPAVATLDAPAPENAMTPPPAPPTCETDADVRGAFGTTCTVVGTYELYDVPGAKGAVLASWPVVHLAGGGRPVLVESVWDASKKPDDATVARLRGRRVAVTGPLHASPPGRIANMAIPCVSPVESLRVLDDDGGAD